MTLLPLESGHSLMSRMLRSTGRESKAQHPILATRSVAPPVLKRRDAKSAAEPVQSHVDRGFIAQREFA